MKKINPVMWLIMVFCTAFAWESGTQVVWAIFASGGLG